MNYETVYLKIEQNVKVTNKKVHLKDIAKIYSTDNNLVQKLESIEIYTIKSDKNTKYCFSILKVLEHMHKEYPGIQIKNLGETDFVLEYRVKKPLHLVWECVKTGFVCLTVFFGAMFTIMTFNTDVSVSDLFTKLYQLVLGHGGNDTHILEISYSIGLPIGILVFFNHFSKLKTHDDPTPLQIEMRNYEEEVNNALIQDAARESKTIDIS